MRSVAVLGCRVDAVGADEAVRTIAGFARQRPARIVVTLGTEMAVRARRDARFRAVLDGCALSLCDTIGIALAARLQGAPLAGRVSGVDLLVPLCAELAARGDSVYLLGARGDTAARAAAALRERVPGLAVAGARDGFFADDAAADVAAAIARTGANVLFAGLGSPRQEFFLSAHLQETGCGVGIGVGGSFDVLAGNVRRAPAIWQRLGLEWLYRLVLEPQRWRRQLALPQFVWLVLRERATLRSSGRLT